MPLPPTTNDDHLSTYGQASNINRTLAGDTVVDHSDVAGAVPVGAECVLY